MLLPICAAIFFFIVEQSVCHSHAICLSPPAHNMKGKTELSHKEKKKKAVLNQHCSLFTPFFRDTNSLLKLRTPKTMCFLSKMASTLSKALSTL